MFPLLVPGEGEAADGAVHHPPAPDPRGPPRPALQYHQVHCDLSSRNILQLITLKCLTFLTEIFGELRHNNIANLST